MDIDAEPSDSHRRESAPGSPLPGPGEGGLLLTPRRLFILLGMLAVAAIVAFRAPSLLAARAQVLEQRQAQAATLAQLAATYSARLYDQSSRVAREVAAHVRSHELSDEALHDYLAARASDTSADDYIVVLDPSGRVRATSLDAKPAVASFPAPDFERRWATTDQEVVPVLKSRLSGATIYSLSQRLEDRNGAFAGVVGVNVKPEGIQPTARRKPDQPLLTVWDQAGRFIAASFVDFTASGEAVPPRKPAGIGTPGSPQAQDGSEISAVAPVPGWPLVAAASFDTRGVLKEWRREVYETLALLALAVVGISALVLFGVRTADRETLTKQALEESNAVAAAALRDRDLLIQEVHHRVKNSLLMTSSLLYLQERRFNDPEVREAFESTRRRLSSIGLVHEALYSGSSREEVDLSQYLTRLIAELTDGYGAEARGIKVTTDVEPIFLRAEQATPVGLIVAEVVTNAFKHAFGPEPAGEIRVGVRRVNMDDIEVEVRDDGSGYPASEEGGHGLGTRLIDALTEQLRGRAVKSNEDGAVFRLVFPMPPR